MSHDNFNLSSFGSAKPHLKFFEKDNVPRVNSYTHLVVHESIKRVIQYFKTMRQDNLGLIVLSTSDQQEVMNHAYKRLSPYGQNAYPIAIHGNTLSALVTINDEMVQFIRELAQGDTMITLYKREGIVVFCEGEDVFDVQGFNVGDCHVFSDFLGETITSIFLGDILEYIISKDSTWESKILEHLSSPFIVSFLHHILNSETSRRIQNRSKRKKTFSEMVDSLIVIADEKHLWDHPFEVIYWFFQERNEKNV